MTTITSTATKSVTLRTLADRAKKVSDDRILRRNDGFLVAPSIIHERDGFNARIYGTERTKEHIRSIADAYKAGEYVEPITIRVVGESIELIEGHCRVKAANLAISEGAELTHLQVNVFEGDDLAANLHVATSNDKLPLAATEQARKYRSTMDTFGLTQTELATRIGRTQGHVSQTLKLLELPEDVIALIDHGAISPSEALAQAARYVKEAKATTSRSRAPEAKAKAYDKLAKDLTTAAKESSTSKVRLTAKTLDTSPKPTKAQLEDLHEQIEALKAEMRSMKVLTGDHGATVTMSQAAWARLSGLLADTADESSQHEEDQMALKIA